MNDKATSGLSAANLQELGDVLRARKAALTTSRDAHLVAARATGAEASDPGDRAEQEIQADAGDSRANVERKELAEIEHALAKIAAGTYGLSEVSGEPIGLGRLRAVPTARVTVAEAEDAGT